MRRAHVAPQLGFFLRIATLTAAAALSPARFYPGPWYARLAKPDWMPPDGLVAPVLVALYLSIAVAGWRAWRRPGSGPAFVLWLSQLAVNALCPYLLFALHRIDLALVAGAVLWLLVAGFVAAAWRLDRLASWLFVPYLFLVSAGLLLGFELWRLN